MEIIITGVFAVQSDAEEAMLELMSAGIPTDDLSYIVLNTEEEFTNEKVADSAESGVRGEEIASSAGAGVIAGGGVGALAGLAIVAGTTGGLGSVVAAGPIATALGLTGIGTTLTGATAGAVIGGLVGVLSGMGIAREDAETYEERVRAGDVLVLVSSVDETEVNPVESILLNHNAEEVRSYKMDSI